MFDSLISSFQKNELAPSRELWRRRQWHPTPVLLPGKSHGWRSLEGCSPWGRWGSDTTERLHFHFSFSCIGERNGTPLQCSCLENPRDGGAWWADVYGVAQSRTRLKRRSSSSSSSSRELRSSKLPGKAKKQKEKKWKRPQCLWTRCGWLSVFNQLNSIQ